MSWNGIFIRSSTVENGVRQGGAVSAVLFCLYTDGLLQRLRDSEVGCFIGTVGALAYAIDVALLAPTPSAMCRLLQICENYGAEFSVAFNA